MIVLVCLVSLHAVVSDYLSHGLCVSVMALSQLLKVLHVYVGACIGTQIPEALLHVCYVAQHTD